MTVRSKKLRDGAKHQPCIRCRRNNGTTVGAHYQGQRSHAYGKGTGIKVHDICIADLCDECHEYFDNPTPPPNMTQQDRFAWKDRMSEDFLNCVMLTLIRRCEQGILTTSDMKL